MPKPVIASFCNTFLKKEMRHIYRQVSALSRYQTFVLTRERLNAEDYPFPDIEELPPPTVHLLPRFYQKFILRQPALLYRGEYEQLLSVLHRRRPDGMHIYFGHTGVHLLELIRRWEKPCLVSFHGMDIMEREHKPQYGRNLRALLQEIPLVLARSESLKQRLIALGCDAEKIRLNRTSVPLDQFPFVERKPPADGAWVFIQAARLVAKKGIPTALAAFRQFLVKHPKAEFRLAGDGPLRKDLEDLCEELGIANSVRFLGFLNQEQLFHEYRAAHVFLHPSITTSGKDQEGVPNSMLEAMATGLPVVATIHGGIPEAVTSGEDGLLTPEGDIPQLTESLFALTSDANAYEIFSRRAAEAVREKFDPARQLSNLELCYDELLQSQR